MEFLLFAFVELYLAFLFISSHQYRFLLPAEIMLTPLLVIMFDNFLDYLKAKLGERTHEILFNLSRKVAVLAFLFIFLGNLHYFEVKFRYIAGLYTEKEYIIVIGGQ